MDPAPLKPILLGTPEELALFLDTNCHNWSLYHNGHDLLSSLQATSYPQELTSIMKAEQVAFEVV